MFVYHSNPTNQSLIQIFIAEVLILIFKLQAESWSCTAFSGFYCSMKAYVNKSEGTVVRKHFLLIDEFSSQCSLDLDLEFYWM